MMTTREGKLLDGDLHDAQDSQQEISSTTSSFLNKFDHQCNLNDEDDIELDYTDDLVNEEEGSKMEDVALDEEESLTEEELLGDSESIDASKGSVDVLVIAHSAEVGSVIDLTESDERELDFRQLFDIRYSKKRGSYRAHTTLRQFHTYSFRDEEQMYSTVFDGVSSYVVAVHQKNGGGNNGVALFDIDSKDRHEKEYAIRRSKRQKDLEPSAVALLKDGCCFAVLSKNEVIRCSKNGDVWTNKKVVEWGDDKRASLRGLTADPNREVVFTYEKMHKMILCFQADNNAHNQVLFFCNYEVPRYRFSHERLVFGNVSFMDYQNGILATSDLGIKALNGSVNQAFIRTYQVDYEKRSLVMKNQFYNPDRFESKKPGFIRYGSGILVDVNGWIIVGDAKQKVLHVFNHDLKPVSIIEHFGESTRPFIAGIAFSPRGAIMLDATRRNAQICLYHFEKTKENDRDQFFR